jgi:hypothetical protein
MAAKLQKTSLQLSPMVLQDMDSWPGLTRSEALRLSIERGHYVSTLNSEEVASLAFHYAPILREALADLEYKDYRLVARSLPALVAGFLSEQNNRIWRHEGGDHPELDPKKLFEELTDLNAVERIGILDCVVAGRYQKPREAVSQAVGKAGPK